MSEFFPDPLTPREKKQVMSEIHYNRKQAIKEGDEFRAEQLSRVKFDSPNEDETAYKEEREEHYAESYSHPSEGFQN